jgi:hypothetical protein
MSGGHPWPPSDEGLRTDLRLKGCAKAHTAEDSIIVDLARPEALAKVEVNRRGDRQAGARQCTYTGAQVWRGTPKGWLRIDVHPTLANDGDQARRNPAERKGLHILMC